MKTIFKVKRKCATPGCASTDCYSLSRGSGGAVSMCRECVCKLYNAFVGDGGKGKKKGGKND